MSNGDSYSKKIRYLLPLFGCVLSLVVIGLGAFTRLVDAGLGCPDWPGCYGHLLWPINSQDIEAASTAFPHSPVDLSKTWPEMVHRYFAGSLLLVIAFIAFLAWRRDWYDRRLPSILLILVICQALFGMWTVTLKLWPQVVVAHLSGGFATISLLWLLFLRSQPFWHFKRSGHFVSGSVSVINSLKFNSRVYGFWWVCMLAVIGQIFLGGWTSANYAALACTELPLCHGQWWPPMDLKTGFDLTQDIGPNYEFGRLENEARTAIHMVHRLGALILVLLLSILMVCLIRLGYWKKSITLAVVLMFQVGMGISNILLFLPLPIAVSHNLGAVFLLLTMMTIGFVLSKQEKLSISAILFQRANTASSN